MSVISKVITASSLVAIGSGLALIIYQQYVLIQRGIRLEHQISLLTNKINKLENALKKVKDNLTSSSSTEDNEEIFEDASDVASHITGDTQRNDKKIEDDNTLALAGKVDKLMDEGGYHKLNKAYTILSGLVHKCPNESEYQWRFAKVCFLIASEDKSKNSGNSELMKAAHAAAQRSIELNNRSGDGHKWMAIVFGSIVQYLPIKEQIKQAYVIKEHIVSAIHYKPNDALLHHMLGRWCFSVYMLTWVERTLAATLFATPPTSTVEEAIEHFLKAEEISPESSIDNALYLGKAYLAKRDYDKAVIWWRVGERMIATKNDDLKSLKEIQELLLQYESYCLT